MDKFIYVFEPAARDALIAAGFLLVKSDERNRMWTFALGDNRLFDLLRADFDMDFDYATSNTLTF